MEYLYMYKKISWRLEGVFWLGLLSLSCSTEELAVKHNCLSCQLTPLNEVHIHKTTWPISSPCTWKAEEGTLWLNTSPVYKVSSKTAKTTKWNPCPKKILWPWWGYGRHGLYGFVAIIRIMESKICYYTYYYYIRIDNILFNNDPRWIVGTIKMEIKVIPQCLKSHRKLGNVRIIGAMSWIRLWLDTLQVQKFV